MQKITPCLWFDDRAEEAARFYTDVFDDSRILSISRYGEAGREVHGQQAGTVMTVEFELRSQKFLALNGGPQFSFSQAVSFIVECDRQDEVDYFWDSLSDGGDKGPCGWLKDRFGLSWQVVPTVLGELMSGGGAGSERVMQAMLQMTKLDIEALRNAYDGR